MSAAGNVGVVVKIVFLTSVEPGVLAVPGRTEDILHAIRCSQVIVTTSDFESPYLLSGGHLVLLTPSCGPVIFRKNHQSVSLNF